jgi:hypothetical protein
VYSDVLIEKGISDKINNAKALIMQKISGMFGSIFGPILAKATKEVARAIKIQIVFDLVIVVGLASIILMALKILKNQKVQHESLVITEAINFGSIAGTVAKIIGTTAGFIFLSAGLLYMTAFLKGYFQKDASKTSIIGFTNIIGGLKKLADNALPKEEKAKANTEDKRVKQLNDIKAKLDNLEGIYTKVITEAAKQKEAYKDSNGFVRFFKTFGVVAKSVGWKGGFDIIATPIVLVATPLKIELPVAFEKLKTLVAKPTETIETVEMIEAKDIISWFKQPKNAEILKSDKDNTKAVAYKGEEALKLMEKILGKNKITSIPKGKQVVLTAVFKGKDMLTFKVFIGDKLGEDLLKLFGNKDMITLE